MLGRLEVGLVLCLVFCFCSFNLSVEVFKNLGSCIFKCRVRDYGCYLVNFLWLFWISLNYIGLVLDVMVRFFSWGYDKLCVLG